MSVASGALPRSLGIAFMVVLVASALTARVVWEGEAELRDSDAAFDRGDLAPALDHARKSATLYAPGAPHVSRAYRRLIAIAVGAEAAAQPKIASLAWQSVRSAALESRHLLLPHQAELERANENLARLQVESHAPNEPDPGTRARALALLNDDEAPAPGWLLVLSLGFVLALTGLALAAVRASRSKGGPAFQRARFGILLFVIGAACWTLAAYRA